MFRVQRQTEVAVLNGEIKCEEALVCLKNGGIIDSVAAYLCPQCQEFMTNNQIFFHKKISESPQGRCYFEEIFPLGKPTCEKCGSELIYINNIRSSKVKCPKCGGDLASKLKAIYD